MIKINRHILDFFIEHNRLSAGRLYFYVKTYHNNHLHLDDFPLIQDKLKISKRVILKCLKQLECLGVCSLYSENYWRFNSWKKWCYQNTNRLDDITLEQLRNLKFLRSFYYRNLYAWAHKVAKNNYKKEHASNPVSGYVDVSSSFVQAVTGTERSQSTILKHLKRAENCGVVKVKRRSKTLAFSTNLYELKQLKESLKIPTVIKRIRGVFYLLSFLSNSISFSSYSIKYKNLTI